MSEDKGLLTALREALETHYHQYLDFIVTRGQQEKQLLDEINELEEQIADLIGDKHANNKL